ncbi:MAG: undecaprenyl-diphosphate phosphatase [Candidatus Pacebacteria bacterium]|nr:undecaprenyl-diphosphate phosphatase [Candidatus Paceibacterota bacterium]PIR63335.1 MAG: undecaprenyl-diphosphatase [Candidatus Pacebacteria bacterium CG10_big_fil_rev_8_21_14_0_10_40_26]PIZ79019.1 MAG: undecaprenyl-diphosphatase [Candidatus Pacebacteria bacterium CG_4_10_14_0_2_um_filter_40_20]PJA68535.1 MAG: undecaprenyl-diphosphatase [Candidatus Pacebacteria bacterium CG_4_9_14_3_um_filter_40_12]PJC41919.1 MAG: undecaprenyl-diphosphatase [Candidatus Pacebacteria bacterium CG_4_9_14_0_2_u
MTVLQAVFLGLVQGLTEFLPVSSSGHLALSQYFVGLSEGTLSFDVFLHFSTLLAVIIFFRKRILALRLPDLWFLGIASIPAVVVGLVFKDLLESAFSSLYLILATLFITGLINLRIARLLKKQAETDAEELTTKKAAVIGIFQSFALLPGISRSGSTVLGAVYSKLSRKNAFEFSFIMSIPVIFGGSMLQLLDVYQAGELQSIDVSVFLIGGLAAFIAGVVSLKVFRYVIEKARFEWFGWYCISLVVFVALFDIVPRL